MSIHGLIRRGMGLCLNPVRKWIGWGLEPTFAECCPRLNPLDDRPIEKVRPARLFTDFPFACRYWDAHTGRIGFAFGVLVISTSKKGL